MKKHDNGPIINGNPWDDWDWDKMQIVWLIVPEPTDTFRAAVKKLPPKGSEAYNELINSRFNTYAMVGLEWGKMVNRLWDVMTPRLFSLPQGWAWKFDDAMDREDVSQEGYIRAFTIVSPFLVQYHTTAMPPENLPNDYELAEMMYQAASTGLNSAIRAVNRKRDEDKEYITLSFDEEIELQSGEKIPVHELLPSKPIGAQVEAQRLYAEKQFFDDLIQDNPKQKDFIVLVESFMLKYPGVYKRSDLVKYFAGFLGLKTDSIRKRLGKLNRPDGY